MIEIFTIVCPLFVKFSEEIHLPYISATQKQGFHCPTYPPPSAMKERRPSIPPQGPLSTAKQFTPSTINMTFSSTIGAIQLNRDSESACRHRTIFIFSVSLNWPPQLCVLCPRIHFTWVELLIILVIILQRYLSSCVPPLINIKDDYCPPTPSL